MKLLFAVIALSCASLGVSANPASAPATPGQIAPAAAPVIRGEVLEVKDVESYTYLRLKTSEGEAWAAVTKAPVKKGEKVTVENVSIMTKFESTALKRTFDKIAFGKLAGAGGPIAVSSVAAGTAGPHGQAPSAALVGDVKVPKATGPDARTVAETITKSAQLKGKTVVIRGKVVKFTPEVMGKNWIHLRDGTGSAADKTDDILVTTKEQTKVGDVVVAKGLVQTDVDLGSGYSYKVLVDGATLSK